jgi:formylglycine-generating enzyme required for sulfatase activity
MLGYEVTLPTEQQWQRAAQGDDGRTYPWGNNWDCQRCNNSVKPCNSDRTTPVTYYEGRDKGDSPFGVVDMAGNVWEWCLNDYNTGSVDININSLRVLRGGSWGDGDTGNFHLASRFRFDPGYWGDFRGFRLALS